MINALPADPKCGRVMKIITAPVLEPISVDEVKTLGRIDGDVEDNLITDMIKGVRECMEAFLGRALITRTVRMTLDMWPEDGILYLPYPPLISITSVEMLDENDVATVYAASNYFTETDSIPGYLKIKDGYTPPVNYDRSKGGYRITYTAGYGAYPQLVPSAIREAMKSWVLSYFENRVLIMTPSQAIQSKLGIYRVLNA